jgi:hypothetical protein
VVGSGVALPQQILALVLFNVCFVLPLLAIVATLWIAGDHADQVLARVRAFLQGNWPLLLSMAALVAGMFVIFLGASAFAASQRGDVGSAARSLRHLLHLHNPPLRPSHKG